MLNQTKSFLSRNYTNALGWRTNSKIVVIESDDWGSIRVPSLEIKKMYEKLGYNLNNNPYCQFDTLANTEDLSGLFDILLKFKDSEGKNPKITFNTVTCNPNFKKIKESGFYEYHFELFTETLKKYYPNENTFKYWEYGIAENLISPQFHGREHVNVELWLKALRENCKPLLDAFNLYFWGVPESLYNSFSIGNIQASYDYAGEKTDQNKIVSEGLSIFEEIFHKKSSTFIANNYIWPNSINQTLSSKEVQAFQGMKYQLLPKLNDKRKKIHRFTGMRNEYKQIYMVRNCIFEPSQYSSTHDNVGDCLSHVNQAFKLYKPAIITSHRLNFIGAIAKSNRKENLKQLNELLFKIIKKWPDVIFMSSDELADYILKS